MLQYNILSMEFKVITIIIPIDNLSYILFSLKMLASWRVYVLLYIISYHIIVHYLICIYIKPETFTPQGVDLCVRRL